MGKRHRTSVGDQLNGLKNRTNVGRRESVGKTGPCRLHLSGAATRANLAKAGDDLTHWVVVMVCVTLALGALIAASIRLLQTLLVIRAQERIRKAEIEALVALALRTCAGTLPRCSTTTAAIGQAPNMPTRRRPRP